MASTTPWLLRPKPHANPALRLFCFPFAGGGASIFRNWWKLLPAHVEVCGVQLPGRESRFRETAFTRVGPLVETLVRELAPFFDRPYAVFGHSMGALIGFELARQSRRAGARLPSRLFLSARRAPQIPMTDEPAHALPDADFVKRLQRFNGTPAVILENPELLELIMPTLRADFAVVETYSYVEGAPLGVPITAFGGAQDPMVPREQLDAWREQTTGAFRVCMVPGGHFFLQSDETTLLGELAGELSP
jgi:medium-chain acyl-[acyl-carrier-protein] hydrolase